MANKQTKKHPNAEGRIIPHSNEAEQGLLCCIMNSDNVAEKVMASGIKESLFYQKSNKNIFRAIAKLYDRNVPIDFATVTEQLDTDGVLDESGGPGYVSTVAALLGNSGNYEAYINIIKKEARLRDLMEASNTVLERCYAGDEDDKALVIAEELITKISEDQGMSALTPFSVAVKEAGDEIDLAHQGQMPIGLSTGFDELDELLGGIGEGDLVVIGARPGTGKTSLGMNIVLNVAISEKEKQEDKKVVAVFSLEMPKKQLAKRMISAVSHVDFTRLSKGQVGDDKQAWRDIVNAEQLIANSRIFIDDSSQITPVEILSKCRRLKREQGRLDLVMIDYLALMQTGKKIENRQQEVADMSRNIKLAAKDLKVPILLLSQLNREAESEKGSKEPKMSNLRESGAIEQDADIIIFIHRPKENDPTEKFQDRAQIIVAKHRNGKVGTIPLRWVGSEVSFRNAPPEYRDDYEKKQSTADKTEDEKEISPAG